MPSQKLLMGFQGPAKGSANEEPGRNALGGWTFQPTLAWANVQALAFYTFHARLAKAGTVSVARNDHEPRSLGRKVLESLVRPVQANAPGCDGLHWLDGSIFRPCCDAHDICYAKAGCNQYSWYWPPSMSWACTGCNALAAYCFYSTIGISTGTASTPAAARRQPDEDSSRTCLAARRRSRSARRRQAGGQFRRESPSPLSRWRCWRVVAARAPAAPAEAAAAALWAGANIGWRMLPERSWNNLPIVLAMGSGSGAAVGAGSLAGALVAKASRRGAG